MFSVSVVDNERFVELLGSKVERNKVTLSGPTCL